MDELNNMFEHFREIDKHHKIQEDEYKRLASDTPKSVKIGQKVLVAVGLLGHGFHWIRQECDIINVSGNSSKIKWISYGSVHEYWIPNCLITSIIGEK